MEVQKAKNVLKENGIIQYYWTLQDIQERANLLDSELNRRDLIKVCKILEKTSAEVGINWGSIDLAINSVKKTTNSISPEDVIVVANSIGRTVSDVQVEKVLERFDEESAKDKGGSWDLIVEHILHLLF